MSDESSVVRAELFDRFSGVHLAAAGFLARYSGRTREAYAADLRTYLTWCSVRSLDVFAASRPHIEIYVRWLEEDRHLAPATVARRLSTVIGFYRFMVIDGQSLAEYVRRPRVSADSQALGLDRMQLGTLVAAAGASGPTDAALITLLGLLGLRVSEACRRWHATTRQPAAQPAVPVPPLLVLGVACPQRGQADRQLLVQPRS